MKHDVAEIQAILTAASVAKKLIAPRVLTLLGFFACGALFGYALWVPNWERAVIASLFAVLVYWPLVRMEKRRQAEPEIAE